MLSRPLLLCCLALGLPGCVNVVTHEPNLHLVRQLGVEQAKSRISQRLQSAIEPKIGAVEVTELVLRYQFAAPAPFGQRFPPSWKELRYDTVERAKIFVNNKVFLYDWADQELAWLQFTSATDATEFADLILSMAERARSLGPGAAPSTQRE